MKFWRKLSSSLRRVVNGLGALAGKIASFFDGRDLFLIAGLGLLAYGLTLIWQPGSYIVPGAILVYVALFVRAAG